MDKDGKIELKEIHQKDTTLCPLSEKIIEIFLILAIQQLRFGKTLGPTKQLKHNQNIIDNGLKMEEENPTISREYIEYDVVTDIKLVPMSRL